MALKKGRIVSVGLKFEWSSSEILRRSELLPPISYGPILIWGQRKWRLEEHKERSIKNNQMAELYGHVIRKGAMNRADQKLMVSRLDTSD
jgi:hypothetical protein